MPMLKLHNNGLLHSKTVIGPLAVDGWVVSFGTARRGLGGLINQMHFDTGSDFANYWHQPNKLSVIRLHSITRCEWTPLDIEQSGKWMWNIFVSVSYADYSD